jgi:tetratricopeptide (TPR) repeat protein
MLKNTQYFLLLLFTSFSVTSQNIDSLKLALKSAKHDTTRCNILISMIEVENDDNIWPKYNNDLLKLVESKLKLSNLTKSEKYFYQKNLAEAINNIGFLAKQKGDISNAINFYNKSLLVYEEILDKKGVANSLINIGAIYFNQDEIQKSLMYFEKSLRIQEEIGDKYGIATSLNNIATIYNDYGDPSENLKKDDSIKSGIVKALKYFEESLKIFEELGDKSKIANSLNNIGCIYFKYGDPSITTSTDQSISIGINKALDYYNKSLIIHKEIGNKVGIAYSLNHIGGIYIKQKNYQKALEFCTKSMQVSKELNYPENIAYAAEKLKIIYSALGKEKLALENYELYIKMRDSINNIETQKATIKQQTKYEFDKQQALEKEKHDAELLIQKEKANADKKKQYIIIFSVSIVLILVGVFSFILYRRFKTTQQQKTIITEQK